MKNITTAQSGVKELKGRLRKVTSLGSILAVLDWDQSVNMPDKATPARGESISELSSIVHTKFLDIDSDGLLSQLKNF